MTDTTDAAWQQKTLEKLLFETLKEQKRKRRWGIFFKLIFVIYFAVFLLLLIPTKALDARNMSDKPHIGLINVDGAIFAGTDASAKNIIKSLNKAFKNKRTQAVILQINSPGGTPVQASLVYNDIMRLRKKYPQTKVYAVCTDVCASAAYYIASAANAIYANPASLVGSIGVLLNGFGFVDTLQKLGIQRRLLTSGPEKGFLDPFSPLKPQDVQMAQTMLDTIHQQFIQDVEKGRGTRINDAPNLFSGRAWTGAQAKKLGLIDGFGSVGYVARHVIKITNIVNYTKKSTFLERFSRSLGENIAYSFGAMFGLNGDALR